MSQIATIDTKVRTVQAQLMSSGFLTQLKMALPAAGVTPERMARIVMTEVRRTPKLASCTLESLLGSVMQCAQLGLEPGPQGLAYLIPYGKECQFQIGYKGLLALAWRSQELQSVQAQCVHEGDGFVYSHGIPPKLVHEPTRGTPGPVSHVYACIGTKSGGWIFDVWTKERVDAHCAQFSKATSGPWKTDWEAMAKKTLLKQALKLAPMSTELAGAVNLDTLAELGMSQEIEVEPPMYDLRTEDGLEIDPETGEVIPDCEE